MHKVLLNEQQLKELDEAIKEADNNEAISLEDFKKEMNEWKNASSFSV